MNVIIVFNPYNPFFLVEIITLHNDKSLLMWNKYTYSRGGHISGGCRWKCSSHNHGCKAFIHTSTDLEVLRMDANHIHLPPNYIKLYDGKYVKT